MQIELVNNSVHKINEKNLQLDCLSANISHVKQHNFENHFTRIYIKIGNEYSTHQFQSQQRQAGRR